MGLILGTAAYMSPEQARGASRRQAHGHLGVRRCALRDADGPRAFPGEDVTETMAAVVKSTPEWSALPADTPASVVSLMQRCLEKDCNARIGDIAVAQFLLSDSSSSNASGVSTVSTPTTTRARSTDAPRIVVCCRWLVAALALGIAGGWLLEKPNGDANSDFEVYR